MSRAHRVIATFGLLTALTTGWAKDAVEPPPLALAPPLDADTKAAGTKLTIRGRTAPAAKVELKINGVIYQATADPEGNFTIHDAPLKDGPNDLRLTATDAAGNATVIDRQVIRPLTSGLVLVPPYDKSVLRTGTATLELSGYCAPNAKLTLKLDGPTSAVQTATADSVGTFRLTAPLAAGGYLVTLRASDGGGTVTRRIEVDLRAPDVQVVSPGPMEYVESAQFEIVGRTQPGTLVTLNGNGAELKVTADARGMVLLRPVPVVDGENQYTLTLTDDLGNQRKLPVTIFGRVTNPWLEVASPDAGWQHDRELHFVVDREAGTSLSATLNGKPVELGASAPLKAETGVPRERTTLAIAPLPPGHYELMVRAVSRSGKRQSGVLRAIHLPGPVRSMVIDASAERVFAGGHVTLAAEMFDAWRQHISDGTAVYLTAPEGWLVDGQLPTGPVSLLAAKAGKIQVRLTAGPGARDGVVLVTAGRLTDSRRLGVVTPVH